jgi:acyl carrier protein
MIKEDAISAVHTIFIEGFEVEEDLLVGTAQLGEDLGLDSLDGIDLVVALEKEFSFRIPEEIARSMTHLQDIYDYIDQHLETEG